MCRAARAHETTATSSPLSDLVSDLGCEGAGEVLSAIRSWGKGPARLEHHGLVVERGRAFLARHVGVAVRSQEPAPPEGKDGQRNEGTANRTRPSNSAGYYFDKLQILIEGV